jgi:hypothetical protein
MGDLVKGAPVLLQVVEQLQGWPLAGDAEHASGPEASQFACQQSDIAHGRE